MTATLDTFSLTSPEDLVASVPHLLSFHPEDSLVVLFHGDDRLIVTARFDLDRGPAALAAHVADVAERVGANRVALLAYSNTLNPAPLRAIVDDVASPALDVLDALTVAGDRFRSVLCDEDCCPLDGRTVSDETRQRVAGRFIATGITPAASRDAVAAEIGHDADYPGWAHLTADWHRSLNHNRDEARLAALDALAHLNDGATDEQIAWASIVVGDVRVRDTYIWDLVTGADAADYWTAYRAWTRAVRLTPPGSAAPAATLAGIAVWLTGDGARANVAASYALTMQPAYNLAALLSTALDASMPPAMFSSMFTRLTRSECLHGTTN